MGIGAYACCATMGGGMFFLKHHAIIAFYPSYEGVNEIFLSLAN
jgi:hypothetical protein